MKRILHIMAKMDRAGAETMLMNLYRNIDREKIQFDFVVFTNDKGAYDDEIMSMGGKIFHLQGKNALDRFRLLYLFFKKHPEYKIIQAHTLLSNAFHLLAAKWAGVTHRLAHSHNTSDGVTGGIRGAYEKWAKKVIAKYSTNNIACNEASSQYLFGNTEALVIPNGVDLEKLNKIAVENNSYIENNFKVKGLKIIQIGRLQTVKNFDFTISLAKKVIDKNPEIFFFLVGKGMLEEHLRERISQLKLEKNVFLLGERADVPELMAGADIMLMPSLFEGFPVVLVESQAIGLPALISDNITQDVDLGLDLVHFESLEHEQVWIKEILNFTPKSVSKELIKQKMKEKKFDVKENSLFLEKFYKDL